MHLQRVACCKLYDQERNFRLVYIDWFEDLAWYSLVKSILTFRSTALPSRYKMPTTFILTHTSLSPTSLFLEYSSRTIIGFEGLAEVPQQVGALQRKNALHQ